MDVTDPRFVNKMIKEDFCVILSRFNEGDLASIKAMQSIRLKRPCAQMIFIASEELSSPILTLMFNEGAFGVLSEPFSEMHAWQLIKQAIKKSRWELDGLARGEELRNINTGLREKMTRVETEASRIKEQNDKLARFVYFLLSDKYFKPENARILVVSKSEYQRNLVMDEFGSLGFKVEACACGKESLPLVKSFKPQILVSDLELPDMSGIDLAKTIKGDAEYPYLHFVITTSNPEKLDHILSPDTMVDDCVIKPTSVDKHHAMVARIALGLLS